MSKGSHAERQLSGRLEDEYGFAAMPAGGSGSGTSRPRPDVFAVRGVRLETPRDGLQDYSNAFAVEVKSWKGGVGQFSENEIEELNEFAHRAGATPLVAVRPDQRSFDGWLIQETSELNRTRKGNYSIRLADHEDCRGISEVFGRE